MDKCITVEYSIVYSIRGSFMRFISVRDLRNRTAKVWDDLGREQDLVVTSNGKPVALLSSVSEETLEERLAGSRRSRALAAVEALQKSSLKSGKDRLTAQEIEAEIEAVRKGRVR